MTTPQPQKKKFFFSTLYKKFNFDIKIKFFLVSVYLRTKAAININRRLGYCHGQKKNNSVGHHSKITIIFLSSLKNYNQVINFYGDKKNLISAIEIF